MTARGAAPYWPRQSRSVLHPASAERPYHHEQYGQALETLLASLPPADTAVEIGPGEGAFLKPLSQRFGQVTGIDISPDMLSKAGDFCEREKLENVSLLAGDTASLLKQGEARFDFAVANMVLHHVPSPKTIFTEVARLLKPALNLNTGFRLRSVRHPVPTGLNPPGQSPARDRRTRFWPTPDHDGPDP